jgi:hypothetical protein
MSRRQNWTDDEEAVLSHFFKAGLSDEGLSKLLGRDMNAIRAKRQKLGLRIYPKKVKTDLSKLLPAQITTPISPPKHADNLPDVGVQMKHLLDDHHIEQAILQDILVQLRDMNSLFRRLEKVTPNEPTKPEK